jgi:hypothetical protein
MHWFWVRLAAAHPSTRRRLLIRLLAKCATENFPPPLRLVKAIAKELDVSDSPRARVRDPLKLRAAARVKAHNPNASFEDIALGIGNPGKKTTVRKFTERPEFKKHLEDEQFLIEHQRKRLAALAPTQGRASKKEMMNGD